MKTPARLSKLRAKSGRLGGRANSPAQRKQRIARAKLGGKVCAEKRASEIRRRTAI